MNLVLTRRFRLRSAYAVAALLLCCGQIEVLRAESENVKIERPTRASSAIALWYGAQQKFGHLGTPQRWLNILGSVGPNSSIVRLGYRLDDGPEMPLNIGPDDRRLAGTGDFNIEIPVKPFIERLADAQFEHKVEIQAYDQSNSMRAGTVQFAFDPRPQWRLPYRVDWRKVQRIQDVVQVVDGKWGIEAGGLRTLEVGYDRAVAMGDTRWGDVEMIAEVTLHAVDERGYEPPSNGPGFGFLTRWQGYVVAGNRQPNIGVWPSGTLVMYRWQRDWQQPRLGMFGNGSVVLALDETGQTFELDTTYIVALRLMTLDDGRSACGLKVWQRDADEPDFWFMFIDLEDTAPKTGAILFIAHHTDVTLGQIAFRKPRTER